MNLNDAALDLFHGEVNTVGHISESDINQHHLRTVIQDDWVVGAALAEPLNEELALLHAIAVAEPARGQGIGQELIDKLCSTLSVERLEAKCRVGLPANEFYEQTGWTRSRQTNDERMNVWKYET